MTGSVSTAMIFLFFRFKAVTNEKKKISVMFKTVVVKKEIPQFSASRGLLSLQ